MTTEDIQTLDRMQRHGGPFASRLAIAARSADSDNLQTLKDAFPGLWLRYGPQSMFAKREEADL